MIKLSLKVKLTAIILSLSMVPLIGATLFQLYYFRDSMEKNIQSALEEARENSSTDIENWLNDKLSQLHSIKKAHPEFKNMDVAQVISVAKVIYEISTELESSMAADKNGMCITNTGLELDVSQRDYFIKAKESKKDHISEILISKVTGNRIIAVISPVLDDSNNFMGILGSMISINAIVDIVEKIKMGESGYGILMTADGTLITHPEEEFIGKTYKDYSNNPEFLNAFENNVLTNNEGFTSYKGDDGSEKLLIYTTIPLTGWKLMIVAYPHEVYSSVDKSFMFSIIIIAVVLLLVIFISIIASILFTRPIVKIAGFMKSVAGGNFSERLTLTRQDEIGTLAESINMMVDSVSQIITSIRGKSGEVDKSASILASTSQEIASASGEVANSVLNAVEKTSEQMESISEIVRRFKEFDKNLGGIYNLLQNVKQGADITEKLSNEGSNQIHKLADSVQDIKNALDAEIKNINDLNLDIRKIDEITSFILAISDQTNLLSLNAAIEAARAGEAGRGFAVVSEEIRKLAEQSKHSSDNITQIVKSVLKSTNDIITTSNNVNEKLGAQINTIEQTTKAFEEILSANLDSIPKIKKMYNDTAEIIKEKDTIVEKTQNIAASAEKITNLTQDISSSAEELTASTQEITSISQDLQHISGELIEKNKVFKT